jgi:hypothetical protein
MTDTAAPPKPKRKGNYKAGPGRPPGSKNRKTLALEEAARQAAASIDGAFEGDAHAFLTAVYRDPAVPLDIRIMAAGRALRVEKPALSASHSVSEVNVNLANRLEAARKRVERINGRRRGDVIEATLEPPAQIIDVSPGGQERS